jgi:hypothetical protein
LDITIERGTPHHERYYTCSEPSLPDNSQQKPIHQ